MQPIKVVVNENLIQDYLYRQVEDDPKFKRLSMDMQGELIVLVASEVDKIMAQLFPPIDLNV